MAMEKKTHPQANYAISAFARVQNTSPENKMPADEPTGPEVEDKQDRSPENLASVVGKRAPPLRLLRRTEVEARTGLSRSTIYLWMQQGRFPKPVKIGAKVVAWRQGDIDLWLTALSEWQA